MIIALKTRRYGRFQIQFDMINDKADKVQEVLSNMIVVQAEPNYAMGGVVYVAIGNLFEEIPEGQKIPDYNLSFELGKLKATKL